MKILGRLLIILVAALVVVGATIALSQSSLASEMSTAPPMKQEAFTAQMQSSDDTQSDWAVTGVPDSNRGSMPQDAGGGIVLLARTLGTMSAIVVLVALATKLAGRMCVSARKP